MSRVCAGKTEYLCFALFNLAPAAYPTHEGAHHFSLAACVCSRCILARLRAACYGERRASSRVTESKAGRLGAAQNVLGVGNEAD